MSSDNKPNRRKFIYLAGGAAAVVIIGGTAYYLSQGPTSTTPSQTTITITSTVPTTTTATTTATSTTTTTATTTATSTTTKTTTSTTPPPVQIIMAMSGEVLSLDPAAKFDYGWPSHYARTALYDKLVNWGRVPDPNNPGQFTYDKLRGDTPELAQKMVWASDNTYIDFYLDPNAKFNSGNPVTAADVKFSFDRWSNPDWRPTNQSQAATFQYDSVEILDNGTRARLHFKQATPLAGLMLPSFDPFNPIDSVLITPHMTANDPAADDYCGKFDVGAGPFTVESWTPGVEIVLVKNKNYWNPANAAIVDQVDLRYVPNSSDRLLTIKEGSVDLADPFLAKSDLKSLESDSNIQILKTPTPTWEPIQINHHIAPFSDKLVRQALAYAIPYDTIINNVFYGYASLLKTPVPVGVDTSDPEFWKYEYNLDTAKSLLAQSSVPNGFDCEAAYVEGYDYNRDIFTWIQAEWKKLGVNLTINAMSLAALTDARYNGTAPMHQWIYSPFARDPFYIFQFWYRKHTLNQWPLCVWWSGPGADQVDALTAQWKDSTDMASRDPVSKQIQQIIVDETPYFLIYQYVYSLPVRKNIKGFWYTPNEHLGCSFRKMTKG